MYHMLIIRFALLSTTITLTRVEKTRLVIETQTSTVSTDMNAMIKSIDVGQIDNNMPWFYQIMFSVIILM